MLPTTVPRDNKVACVRCGKPALVRYSNTGWLCCDHAAECGCPIALQIKTLAVIDQGMERVFRTSQKRVG